MRRNTQALEDALDRGFDPHPDDTDPRYRRPLRSDDPWSPLLEAAADEVRNLT